MTQQRAFFLSLTLLAAFGFFFLLRATPEGLGLNDDSIAYVAGARGIISGEGYREIWIVSKGPLTHFPPGFSGALALIGFITGLDPLRVARALNAFYFGINAALLGVLGWRATKSRVVAVFLGMLFIATPIFLRIHSMAMSEPQYIFLSLIAVLLFDLYFEEYVIATFGKQSPGGMGIASQRTLAMTYLILCGVVVGFAYITRYAALALLATLFCSLLILHDTWKIRFQRAGIFLLGALPVMFTWTLRNSIVGGSATNRNVSWHPITAENARMGMREFSMFITPVETWRMELNKTPNFYAAILIFIALVLLAWILYTGLRRFFLLEKAPRPATVPFVNALYIFAYFSSIVVTMTWLDPATKFQARIVAPLFVSFILVLAIFGHGLARKHFVTRAAMVCFAIFFLGMSVAGQRVIFDELSRGGQLYASYRWYDSKILKIARDMPADIALHTNQPEAVYLYTNRACSLLPASEEGIAELQEKVKQGKAVIFIFVTRGLDQETMDYYESLGKGLKALREGNSVLYVAP